MGRMHAPGKGISQSALPYRRTVPQWLKLTSEEVKDQIFKLAKKGLTPSQIGVILRDSHGVAQVCLMMFILHLCRPGCRTIYSTLGDIQCYSSRCQAVYSSNKQSW